MREPGLVVRRGALFVDSVDGTPSLAGAGELPMPNFRYRSLSNITDQHGVLNTTHGYVLVARAFGMHANIHLHARSSCDDRTAIAPDPLWRTGLPSHAEVWLAARLRQLAFNFRLLHEGMGRAEQRQIELTVLAAWQMEQDARQDTTLGLSALSLSAPMVGTGQSAQLDAAERAAAFAVTDALERLAAEEGESEADDVFEALEEAWMAADQRGDAAEAERLLTRLGEFDNLTDQLYADARRIREAEQDEAGGGWSEAQFVRAEAAIEEREERSAEQAARSVLFDDLQRSWSDARYVAERDTQEREEEEEWMAERVEGGVVEVEDRPWEG